MTECTPDFARCIRQRGGSWQGADHQSGPWRSIPAPQQALPGPTDGPAVPEGREPASVAPEPTGQPLSPAAQAVLDAFLEVPIMLNDQSERIALAAALRALADLVLIRPEILSGEYSTLMRILDGRVRAIAAELEGQP